MLVLPLTNILMPQKAANISCALICSVSSILFQHPPLKVPFRFFTFSFSLYNLLLLACLKSWQFFYCIPQQRKHWNHLRQYCMEDAICFWSDFEHLVRCLLAGLLIYQFRSCFASLEMLITSLCKGLMHQLLKAPVVQCCWLYYLNCC